MPPGFRGWGEYEYRARELTIWVPNVPDGIAQTADYARALLSTSPGATDNVIDARLRNRLERQQRLLRDDGPAIVLLVDQVALYRGTGSAQIMAAQCRRLIEVSALETVTLQIVPHVAHPLATAVAYISNEAGYTENALGGQRDGAGHDQPRGRDAEFRRLGVGAVHQEPVSAGAEEGQRQDG